LWNSLLELRPGRGYVDSTPIATIRRETAEAHCPDSASPPESRRARILVVDDEESVLFSFRTVLGTTGHEVVTVDTGSAAIEEVKRQAFDIAFVDIRMPDPGGPETMARIRELSPTTIVIMITAFAQSDLVDQAVEGGATLCLFKPFGPAQIRELIGDVLIDRPRGSDQEPPGAGGG
jgi:CheY-like chemotaxis protein